MDSPYIRHLLQAEEEAESKIDAANKGKQELLKQAESAAIQEAELFKTKQEREYQEQIKKIFSNNNEDEDLNEQTKIDIQNINNDYEKRKGEVMNMLIQRMLDVDLTLPNVIKKNLTMIGQKK